MADFLEGKNPVTVAMIAVLIVVTVIAVFSGNITGYATQSTEVSLLGPNGEYTEGPLYVGVYAHEGWGLCTGDISWSDVDRICKSKGFSGALPEEGATGRPCLHEQIGTAYIWDKAVPIHLGEYITQNGYGLTAIKCVQ